jgi:hypothetical protein
LSEACEFEFMVCCHACNSSDWSKEATESSLHLEYNMAYTQKNALMLFWPTWQPFVMLTAEDFESWTLKLEHGGLQATHS